MKVENLSENTLNTVEEVEVKKTKTTQKKKEDNKKDEQTKKVTLTKDMAIKIISNFDGTLAYTSPNGMVSFEIDEYGGYDFVELSTLIAMKNAHRRYFMENWIIVDDGDDYTSEDVYKFLKIDQYYKNVYKPENIDKLFSLSPDKIKHIVEGYSASLKQTIFRVAKKKHEDGMLDSVAKIRAIEEAVGIKFDE